MPNIPRYYVTDDMLADGVPESPSDDEPWAWYLQPCFSINTAGLGPLPAYWTLQAELVERLAGTQRKHPRPKLVASAWNLVVAAPKRFRARCERALDKALEESDMDRLKFLRERLREYAVQAQRWADDEGYSEEVREACRATLGHIEAAIEAAHVATKEVAPF